MDQAPAGDLPNTFNPTVNTRKKGPMNSEQHFTPGVAVVPGKYSSGCTTR